MNIRCHGRKAPCKHVNSLVSYHERETSYNTMNNVRLNNMHIDKLVPAVKRALDV